jgi:hypothetical protein
VIHFRGTFRGGGNTGVVERRWPTSARRSSRQRKRRESPHRRESIHRRGGVRKREKGGVGDPWLKQPMGDRDRSNSMIGRPDVYFRYFFPGPCPLPFILRTRAQGHRRGHDRRASCRKVFRSISGRACFQESLFSGEPAGRLLPTFHAAEAGKRNRVLRNYHSNNYHSK